MKSSKNQSDLLQTGRQSFCGAITLETAQFYSKETRTCFPAITLHAEYFKHRKGKTLFCDISSKELNLVANKPKHSFGNIKWFGNENRGKGCSQKDNAENSVT